MPHSNVDRLISHLYRSATTISPECFRSWALQQLAQVIDFDAAFWGTGTWTHGTFHYTSQIGLDDHYGDHLVASLEINPIKDGIMGNLGQVVDMRDVYPDSAFFQSPLYRRLFQPYGISRILACGNLDERSGLYSLISLYRFDRDHPFSATERALQDRLIHHLIAAASLNFFVQLELLHPDDQSVTAICDRYGCFYEAQPDFLERLQAHFPERESMALPIPIPRPGEQICLQGLLFRSQPLGDLHLIYVRDCGPLDQLTHREREVVELVCRGRSYKEAARVLNLAPSTVSNHLYRVYNKLGISTRGELAQLVV